MAPPGILSSFSSWWGTGSSGSGPSSGSSYYQGNTKNKSPYSSTYSAWSTSPYNERGTGAAANYPPQPRTSFSLARPSASVADFTNMYPTGSTSNLVSPQTPHQAGGYPYEGAAGASGSGSGGGGGMAGGSGSVTPRYSTSASMRPAISSGSTMPSSAYPPLRHTWNRIRKWAKRNYTELSDTLNWPANEAQIDALEMAIGMALPPAVRESYLCYNGQETESKQSCSDGLFFGLNLLSLERIAEEWQFWRAVDEDPATGANQDVNAAMASCPDGWVRPVYSSRGWVPLMSDNVGNYIGVDLYPHPSGAGSPGQVIAFGRDIDTKVVLWRGDGEGGWGRFLQSFAEELEAAECYTLGDDGETGSSGEEEDSIGYESYFSNGGAGASKGLGDRGGDGAYGFHLTGEYKGWPVVEAWADRSMRFWQTVGLQAGMPNGGPEARQRYLDGLDGPNGMAAPRVRIAEANDEEDDAYASARDQITAAAAAAAAEAEQEIPPAASSSSSIASQQALSSGSGTSGNNAAASSLAAGQTHPLEEADSTTESAPADGDTTADASDEANGRGMGSAGPVPLIYTDDSGVSEPPAEADPEANGNPSVPNASGRNISDTLSPPLPTSKGWRSKQKQREVDPAAGARGPSTAARRRSPPVPAAPIQLPTLEEVLSEQAAVLAEDGGPPIDAGELYNARSTVPVSNSGGVAALLPTALGGVGGLSRVLSTSSRRASSKRSSSLSGTGAPGSGPILGSSGSGVFGGKPAGYWDGPGRHSGMSSPVHRDSLTPLGSPRRSADESNGFDPGANGGKRSSWSLASAAAAGLGVLGTTLSGQRSPRQSYGGHGAEGSSGSSGSGGGGGGGAGLSSVRVVGQDDSVELSNRTSADDLPASGRALFATDGSLGGHRHASGASTRLANKAQPPLPGNSSSSLNSAAEDFSSADTSVDPLVEQPFRRRDLSHRSPLHSPNLRGQYDADVFTPADQAARNQVNGSPDNTSSLTARALSPPISGAAGPAKGQQSDVAGSISSGSGKKGTDLLIDAPNSPMTDETPVTLGTTKVDA
ncbi:Cell wall assembly regulator [Tilletia horrida]|nr:Cell wall assembly regulator [Tilletia horrida]